MNIKQYISSGILEAYALGELTDEEKAGVEKSLAQYPELKIELSLIEEVQEQLLLQAAIRPRAEIKTQLFEKLHQSPVIVSMEERSELRLWQLAVAASVTIALAAAYLAFDYRSKWKNTESDLTTLIARNRQVVNSYNQVNQRLKKMKENLKVLDNPDFVKVIMKGTSNAPQAQASVYWNESSKEVYLSVQNMKTLTQTNQYQLWAIIDGKPVDAGVFDFTTEGLIKMKNISPGAVTFAITIEPRGGKPSPSLETMQVAGNVVKS